MERWIPIITKKTSRKIDVDNILYVMQKQRKMEVVTVDGSYECYERIDSLEHLLKPNFIRPLKKYVINLEKIDRIEKQNIYLENGQVIKMGKEAVIRVNKSFKNYLQQAVKTDSLPLCND